MTTEKQPEALPSQEMFAAQAQKFSSAWAIVGGRFDVTGNGLETAKEEKAILLDMARRLYARITELEAQLEAVGAGGVLSLTGAKQCPGIPRAGCNYLTTCNSVCNKCGNVHHTHQLTADQPAPAVVGSLAGPNITLDFKMATELLEMYGGEPTEITLQNGTGHSGTGVYAYYAEIPEEGAEFLGVSNDDAIPVTQPQQIAEPASQWIGVNERLPVWVVRDDTPCFINGKEIPPTLFSETVLVALKGGGVRTDKLTTIEGKSEGWWHTYGERVAAWMLAPKPPTQKEPS